MSTWIVAGWLIVVGIFLLYRRHKKIWTPVELKNTPSRVRNRNGFERKKANEYRFAKRPWLFSPAEKSFYDSLKPVLSNDFEIFGKVRIADVIEVNERFRSSKWQSAFNKVAMKHFDFVICSKSDLSVVCCVELNDGSHKRPKTIERDSFVNKVCSKAGVPLVTIKQRKEYLEDDLRIHFERFMNSDNKTEKMLCPKCESELIERVSNSGANAGKKFLGCSAFPQCKHIAASIR